ARCSWRAPCCSAARSTWTSCSASPGPAPPRRSAARCSSPAGRRSRPPPSFPAAALPERGEADPLAPLLERDADRGGRAPQQAAGPEPGQRGHLEAPEPAVRIHAEIRPAVHLELERPMRGETELLHAARLLRGQVRGEDLVRAARLVLRGVVENRREAGNDLADGERLVVEDADRELPAGDVALDHH